MSNSESYTNVELVTLAIYLLGGSANAIDVEDIAVESYKLAPKRFSWKKYPDQIDIKIVQYSIQGACKDKPGYVNGGAKFGYMLTKAGLSWAEKINSQAEEGKKPRKFSSVDLLEKERYRLAKSQAYIKFINGRSEEINNVEFREFTRVEDYFPKNVREEKYAKIENAVRDDGNLVATWKFLKEKFSEEK